MNQFTNPLDKIKIASPCSQDWNSMIGDNRRRFCGDCKLNVYNLSAMTKAEAEQLIMNAEGRLCVKFYKRADGTVITEDCPVGWAACKKRISKTAAALVSLLFGVLSGLGFSSFFSQKQKTQLVGMIAATPTPRQTPKTTPTPDRIELMGDVAAPTPKQTQKSQVEIGRFLSVR